MWLVIHSSVKVRLGVHEIVSNMTVIDQFSSFRDPQQPSTAGFILVFRLVISLKYTGPPRSLNAWAGPC